MIILFFILFSLNANAAEPAYIRAINPNLAHAEVIILSNQIRETCKKYKIPCTAYSNILAHESRFQKTAINVQSRDYGISQINFRVIADKGWDQNRILADQRYALERGAEIVLEYQRRFSTKEPNTWICRYNVGTGKLVGQRLKNCLTYLDKLNKIKQVGKK